MKRPTAPLRFDDTARSLVVLVVDDDVDTRDSLGEVLDVGGFEAAFAANGLEALNYLDTHAAPAVIVSDLNMPVMTGWELVRRLRLTRFQGIPVVVVSSSDPGCSLAPHLVLRKPVGMDDLLGAMRDATSPA